MNSDIQIIVDDVHGMALNGKPVEFNLTLIELIHHTSYKLHQLGI